MEVTVDANASLFAGHRPAPSAGCLPASAAPNRPPRTLAVGVIGPGRVGGALLTQIRTAQPRLQRDMGLNLQLRGVASRQRMWLDCDDPELDARDGAQTWRPADLKAFSDHVHEDGRPAVLIDCSASEDVAVRYPLWLAAGVHVVTPSKLAGSGPLARWRAMRAACAHGARFRYETTVCAGLPVIQTLRDLLDTGDELFGIEGMFSGTLAWLCNRHDGQQPFSALLREAHALGYTEPDPREDLSGIDVARKLVILAREAGHSLSLEEVEIESLLPPALATLSTEDFKQRAQELDEPMTASLARARIANGVLRHVGSLDRHGRARVRLTILPSNHPFAHTRLTDNVVQFRTQRYRDNPLLVQGPGAGPEVTAAGVFADVLRIADTLAVPSCAPE
jgi:aspartokinase/homoserine dehydrogenase 1